ncbi:hypothetical protein ANCCAN_09667 [Ancylostoma caninum]|uniref:NTR domain-containing protein n=1 Tax=Ancylostoma caninum TaxID=29170 RepID=A0A368GIV0_ANCCA|nr:hypothetical protein ANCCAN_09667 [Ancylostoma caninum]
MWYLFAFLACLNIVRANAQCTCPRKAMDVSLVEFVVVVKVTNEEEAEDGLRAYDVTDLEIFKPENHANFGSKVYTNVKGELFTTTLITGRRYILKGVFDNDGNKPFVTSCELLAECN